MASIPTIKELRSMQAKDLQSEIAEQSLLLSKIRLDVANMSEKDTAKLRRLRKGIARMNTVLNEKQKTSTVRAPKAA
jgi:ribosomal protein L29